MYPHVRFSQCAIATLELARSLGGLFSTNMSAEELNIYASKIKDMLVLYSLLLIAVRIGHGYVGFPEHDVREHP
jgi:hypothetical protein